MMCLHATIAGLFFRLGCRIERPPQVGAGAVAPLLAGLHAGPGVAAGNRRLRDAVGVHTVESWPGKIAFEGAFGKPDRRLVVLVTTASARGGDMLTLTRLQAAHAVHEMVTGVAGYGSLCIKAYEPDGPCVVSSVLAAWNYARPSGDVNAVLGAACGAGDGPAAAAPDGDGHRRRHVAVSAADGVPDAEHGRGNGRCRRRVGGLCAGHAPGRVATRHHGRARRRSLQARHSGGSAGGAQLPGRERSRN